VGNAAPTEAHRNRSRIPAPSLSSTNAQLELMIPRARFAQIETGT
jgi:hypothetical protein